MAMIRNGIDTVVNLIGSNGAVNKLKGDGSFTSELNKLREITAQRNSTRHASEQIKAGHLDAAQRRVDDDLAKSALQTSKGNVEGAKRTAASANARGALLEDYSDLATRHEGDQLSKEFSNLSRGKLDSYNQQQRDSIRGLGSAAKSYYFDGTLGERAMRAGVTAGAVGAAAVGTRYMTGGTATTNNRGQRDIAGIPFI